MEDGEENGSVIPLSLAMQGLRKEWFGEGVSATLMWQIYLAWVRSGAEVPGSSRPHWGPSLGAQGVPSSCPSAAVTMPA